MQAWAIHSNRPTKGEITTTVEPTRLVNASLIYNSSKLYLGAKNRQDSGMDRNPTLAQWQLAQELRRLRGEIGRAHV